MKKQLLPFLVIIVFFISLSTGCIKLSDEVPSGKSINYINGEPALEGREEFKTDTKVVPLHFTYNGESWIMNYTVYKGMNDYLASLPRSMPYGSTTRDFILEQINEVEQQDFLVPLVRTIKKITENKDDQARISISIVQNIPYDWVGVNTSTLNNKYPYEVLYTQKGVCGEKSNLLMFLLKEIGVGVVSFEFEHENHRAVGIKCSLEYSYNGTGFCFVETASPTIITDSDENYVGVGKLTSCSVITISTGLSFESISVEYKDAQEYIRLNKLSEASGGKLSQEDYNKWCEIVTKYGIGQCQSDVTIYN
jgi:hypothetical protein